MSLGRPRATCALFHAPHFRPVCCRAQPSFQSAIILTQASNGTTPSETESDSAKNTSKPYQGFSEAGFSRHQGALFRRFLSTRRRTDAGQDFPPLFPAKMPLPPQSQFAIKTALRPICLAPASLTKQDFEEYLQYPPQKSKPPSTLQLNFAYDSSSNI